MCFHCHCHRRCCLCQIRHRNRHVGHCNGTTTCREHKVKGFRGRQWPHAVLRRSIYGKRHTVVRSLQRQNSDECCFRINIMPCERAIGPVIIAVDTSPYRTVVEFRVMVVVVPMNIVVQRVRRCDCSYKPPRFACQSNGDDSTARQRSNKHWSRCREATKTISAGKHAINDRAEMTINQGECLRACKT